MNYSDVFRTACRATTSVMPRLMWVPSEYTYDVHTTSSADAFRFHQLESS